MGTELALMRRKNNGLSLSVATHLRERALVMALKALGASTLTLLPYTLLAQKVSCLTFVAIEVALNTLMMLLVVKHEIFEHTQKGRQIAETWNEYRSDFFDQHPWTYTILSFAFPFIFSPLYASFVVEKGRRENSITDAELLKPLAKLFGQLNPGSCELQPMLAPHVALRRRTRHHRKLLKCWKAA